MLKIKKGDPFKKIRVIFAITWPLEARNQLLLYSGGGCSYPASFTLLFHFRVLNI